MNVEQIHRKQARAELCKAQGKLRSFLARFNRRMKNNASIKRPCTT